MAANEGMTDDKLAELRVLARHGAEWALEELLDEIDRLRAENEGLKAERLDLIVVHNAMADLRGIADQIHGVVGDVNQALVGIVPEPIPSQVGDR